MITCPSCSKQNQDHYRFCLGCGAELPRGAVVKRETNPPPDIADERTNVGGAVSQAQAGAGAVAEPMPVAPTPAAAEAPPVDDVAAGPPGTCPECGQVNPPTNRFCATCGHRLDAPATAPAQKTKLVAGAPAVVLVALDPEGNEIGRHEIGQGETTVGRATGGIFASDSFLSPAHARFNASEGKVTVADLDSLNGLFRKLLADTSERLAPGQRFRIGQELLLYEGMPVVDGAGVVAQGGDAEGVVGTVALVVGRETMRPSHPISERGINMGRERGDLLFPEDGYVSGLHCHISYEDGDVWVTDLGSSNGTFVQLIGEAEVSNGDVLLMGQQLFRVTL